MIQAIRGYDLGWVVGLFDAEGWAGASIWGDTVVVRVIFTQKNRELLDRVVGLVGSGKPWLDRNREHPVYRLTYWGKTCVELATVMLPHVSAKRRDQIQVALSTYANRPKKVSRPPANLDQWIGAEREHEPHTPSILSTMESRSAQDVGWLAAFFDGEGTIRAKPWLGPRSNSIALRMSIPQKERELLDRVVDIIGSGTVRIDQPKSRPAVYRVDYFGDTCARIATVMLPHVSTKRRGEIELALSTWNNRPRVGEAAEKRRDPLTGRYQAGPQRVGDPKKARAPSWASWPERLVELDD